MFVMRAQPMGEMRHFLVTPHPRGKACEWVFFIKFRRMVAQAQMAHMAINARSVGPISLDRDDIETMLGDQPLRDRCARLVEFGRAMRRFTEQHDTGVCVTIKEGAEGRSLLRFWKMDAQIAHKRCGFIGALCAKPCGRRCIAHGGGSSHAIQRAKSLRGRQQ